MTTPSFELLNVETYVLKVNINCQGCAKKVRKRLQKIEGVYSVNVNAEQEQVTVVGRVSPDTLINKLMKTGKHAELWSPNYNQLVPKNRDHENNKDPKIQALNINELNPYQSKHVFSSFGNQGWEPEWYLKQNLMPVTQMENMLMGEQGNTIVDVGNLEEGMIPNIEPRGFRSYNSGFVGLENHESGGLQGYSANEYNHLPPLMRNNMQYYNHNDSIKEIMDINMQDPHTRNNMENERDGIYMQQSQMINY